MFFLLSLGRYHYFGEKIKHLCVGTVLGRYRREWGRFGLVVVSVSGNCFCCFLLFFVLLFLLFFFGFFFPLLRSRILRHLFLSFSFFFFLLLFFVFIRLTGVVFFFVCINNSCEYTYPT
jgi:ABC-type multidrug transport system fused ATPase/permease subunit